MADSGSPPRSEPSPRSRRRWPWILLALALALALVIRALLPLAVERGAAWGSRRYLGLPVSIDNVDFSLLRGRVTVEGLTVGPYPDSVTPLRAAWRPPRLEARNALLHWDRVAVRFSWWPLLHRTLHLEDVTVNAPEARVTRETDGRLDPLRHAHPTATPTPEPAAKAAPSAEPRPPWKIRVDHFELRRPEVRVVDAASGADVIRFSLEDFGLQQVALQGKSVALGSVSISGPVLRVRRDLIFGQQPAASAPSAPAAGAPAASPPVSPAGGGAASGYRIDHIDIERAEFVWITDAGPVQVALSLKASDVTAQPGQRFPIDLQLEIEQGKIGLRGQAGIVPPAFAGSLAWSGLPFPPLALAAAPDLARWLRSCQSSGELKLDADLGAKDRPDVTLSGNTSIDDLWIADPDGKEVSLKWKRLAVKVRELALWLPEDGEGSTPTKIALDRVELVAPEVRYTRPSPSLEALLAAPPKQSDAGAPPPAAQAPESTATTTDHATPVDLSLASFELRDADLELLDRTVKPETRTQIRGLSISARDLRYPQPAAQAIRVRATLPQGAPLAVDGGTRPGNSDFTLSLKRLDLPSFDPYASAAGATLSQGHASLQTKVRLRGDRIQADSDLVLSKLGVSLRDPESFQRRFGVPLDLALALLRDPAGDIHLSIPVEMDEQAARVSLVPVVASAVRQALIGALTTPLKMGGAAFSGLKGGGGAGGVSIEPLLVVPGSTELARDQSARLEDIAKLLTSRPALGLVLRGRTGPADRPALAERILLERVQAGEDLPKVQDAGFFARRRLRKALEKRAGGKAADLSAEDQVLYDRMVTAVPVPEARLQALARQRADAARALLVAQPGIEGTRVTVGEPAGQGPPAVLLGFRAE